MRQDYFLIAASRVKEYDWVIFPEWIPPSVKGIVLQQVPTNIGDESKVFELDCAGRKLWAIARTERTVDAQGVPVLDEAGRLLRHTYGVFFDSQVTSEFAQAELNSLTPLAKDALRIFLMKTAPAAPQNANSSRSKENSSVSVAKVGLLIATAIIVVIGMWGYWLRQRESDLESRITELVGSKTELERRNEVLIGQLNAASSEIENYKQAGGVSCRAP
jgi:hypothetical protein